MKKFLKMSGFIGLLLCLSLIVPSFGLDNGEALTPPMGWLTWERFRCNTDCNRDPDECISERLIRNVADRMVEDGYLAAGYQYVIIDDCWLSRDRDENGRLKEDPDRFPSGMKNLSDYVHSKGLKFGLYEDVGTNTCAGYPGSLGHFQEDVETLVDQMGADYIKLDGCNIAPEDFDVQYPAFGKYLEGKKVVYSCEWPLYQAANNIEPNYTAIERTCNMYRNWYDVEDSWQSVSGIADRVADTQDTIIPHNGPGHWNDPDMLIIGDYGLSYEQSKTQMILWCVWASPLIMSHDLRTIRPEYRDILLNQGAIAINQDPLGIQGRRVFSADWMQVWVKPIQPVVNNNYSYAVAIRSTRTDGAPYWFEISLKDIGITSGTYLFSEVFGAMEDFTLTSDDNIVVRVNPTGSLLFKATLQA